MKFKGKICHFSLFSKIFFGYFAMECHLYFYTSRSSGIPFFFVQEYQSTFYCWDSISKFARQNISHFSRNFRLFFSSKLPNGNVLNGYNTRRVVFTGRIFDGFKSLETTSRRSVVKSFKRTPLLNNLIIKRWNRRRFAFMQICLVCRLLILFQKKPRTSPLYASSTLRI